MRFDEGEKNPREMQRSRVFYFWRTHTRRYAGAARDVLACAENRAV
ncbi:hypothetical protein [Burkholderia metallica]|nr:hypothetical protein [Burkholderia metallica]MCA8018060.1 hypothetical protein [Burkholderia metallica]